MTDNLDWLMRPVLNGMCKFESIIDGTLTLDDVATMNEALDVKFENELRTKEYLARKAPRG